MIFNCLKIYKRPTHAAYRQICPAGIYFILNKCEMHRQLKMARFFASSCRSVNEYVTTMLTAILKACVLSHITASN